LPYNIFNRKKSVILTVCVVGQCWFTGVKIHPENKYNAEVVFLQGPNNKFMKSYDPYMHTTEHILNRTMVNMFGCDRSFSNHLEKKKSKCDYRFNRALTTEEEALISEKVNEQLARNLDVTQKVVSREEAAHEFDLDRLPDAAGDTICLVSVGDYDVCPCIGDHVRNTSEIGVFVLVSSSFNDGVLRIRFKLK
jgi:alanyl-tRNA synthetase